MIKIGATKPVMNEVKPWKKPMFLRGDAAHDDNTRRDDEKMSRSVL